MPALPRRLAPLLLCLLLNSASVRAQEFRFERFTVNEGLASSKVFDIAQDEKGLIWIGTELGLCRYNGSAFQTYSVLDGLPGNSVIDLFPDAQGRLWLLLQSSLGYWQGHRYTPLRHAREGGTTRFTSLVGDGQGALFVSTQDGIWQLEDEKLLPIPGVEMPVSGSILLSAETDGTLWFGSGRTVMRLKNGELDTLVQNTSFAKRHYCISDHRGRTFYVSTEKVLELTEAGAIPVYPAVQQLLSGPADLSTVFIDPEGNWWIGSFDGGLYFFPADQLEHGNPVRYLERESITDIFQDRDDNLWVGTDAAGLFLLSYRARQVRNVRGDADGRLDALFSKRLRSADQVEWYVNRNRQQTALVARTPAGDSLSWSNLGNPYKIIRGPENSVFLTSSSGFYNFRYDSNLRVASSDAKGNRAQPLPSDPWRLLSGPSRVAWYDSLSNGTWLYSMEGLLRYRNGVFDTLEANTEERKLIISGMVGLPGQETIWMSSYGMGLYLLQGDSLYRFGTADGLNSNSLVDVWLDDDGDLWVIGSNGVNKLSGINYNDRTFRVYSLYENDGLIIGEVRGGVEWRDTIWLRTNAGLSYFPSDLITREPRTNPGLEITSVIIANRDTVLLGEYDLRYRQNDLEIRFSAIAFSDSRRIRYRYRVLGLDENWKETDFGELRLSKLRPGTYTVELRSVDIYDMESAETERIRFVIHPAIWQQVGYQVLAAALFLSLVIGLVWMETRRRARVREDKLILEKQLAETEQKALRAQMNPHFIYNVLNSIQQYILRNDTESAMDYLAEFGDLIRRSFENSKHMAIPLSDEIAFLNTYLMLEKMRFDELLDYEVIVGLGVDIHHTFVPSLLIQPFVENSIRHGLRHKAGAGRVQIQFIRDGDQLTCIIDDDGIGIDQAMETENWKPEEHRSSGMEITRSRLRVFNKVNPGKVGMEVFDRKQLGETGTRVVLTIPILVEGQIRVTDGESSNDPLRDHRRRAEGPGIPT